MTSPCTLLNTFWRQAIRWFVISQMVLPFFMGRWFACWAVILFKVSCRVTSSHGWPWYRSVKRVWILWGSGIGLVVVGCRLSVVCCGLSVVCCRLSVVGCGLWVVGCGLWVV